eukprot:scaffold22592_cov129-Cylindrotheca_fusiformis.AAC.6
MKLNCIAAALSVAGLKSQASAFTAPKAGRVATKLDVTTLEEWQLLDNGSVVGSVRGHPDLSDGDIVTTSPLSSPGSAMSNGVVTTLTGSEYKLGTPMQLKRPNAPAGVEEPGMDRSSFLTSAGLVGLFAGGVAVGVGVSNSGEKPLSVPEAKIGMAFPGAVTNDELMKKLSERLTPFGYGANSLVATSLCCDEVNRPLEKALAKSYDEPFVMGGLAGFPFGGVTSFGAMAHHIPDGGSCLVVYGPHVGVDAYGSIGTVNRRGRAKGGACCGSGAAALAKIRKGQMVPMDGEAKSLPPTDSLDAQQAYVDAQLAPYAQRLLAADDRNVELPYALYDAQKKMMDGIVAKGAGAMEGNGKIALLGGIQINTPEEYSDYFLPLNFDLLDNKGKFIKSLIWS